MEQQNLTTSQDLQTPETIEAVPNLGVGYVLDDNPESKDGGFNVTSDEKAEYSIDQEIDYRSDNDNAKNRKIFVTSNNKPEDDINRGHSEALQNNFKDRVVEGLDISKKKLEDSIDGRCSVTLGGISGDRHNIMTSYQISDVKPDVRIDDAYPTYSIDNQSGYECDVDTIEDGESSGNVTDSDSETKKILADKANSVIEKIIAKNTRLDLIAKKIYADEENSDFLGSSCTDTVSEYNSTDVEEDTNKPR